MRHEFYDGMIVAMAGGSDNHSYLALNLLTDLSNQLEGGPCRTAGSDFHLYLPESNAYFYPDGIIVCRDTRSPNAPRIPRLVIEVLSASTEAVDREYKRNVYHASPTILEYLIIDQDRVFVEHDCRSDANSSWTSQSFSQLDDIIHLVSISATLSLSRIYRDLDEHSRP